MADIKSPEARSRNMAKIKNRDTKPEEWLRKRLHSKGYRYRKNVEYIVGHPDAYLTRYQTAVFVHGCFWHRHRNCKYAYTPKSHTDFWERKFDQNIARDEVVMNELKKQRVKELVIWECTIKRMMKSEDFEAHILQEIDAFLRSDEMYLEM